MAMAKEGQVENQIGCMAGFLHIFDRPLILSPKRFSSPRRLPLPLDNSENHQSRSSTPELRSPAPEPPILAPENLTRSPLTLPIIEFKEGSRSPWKFSKEAPRLSLDSRAVVDAKGSLKPRQIRPDSAIPPPNRRDTPEGDSQRRSPSVIARLMGLEPLPTSDPEQPHKAELRRSASESRVNREYRFVDGLNFQVQQSQTQHNSISSIPFRDEQTSNGDDDPREFLERNTRAQPSRATPQQRCAVRRKSFFDSTDFFPEPKQTGPMAGDLEKRIRMRSIDEHPSDLETLKQLLEAFRLKGLLHSSNGQQNRISNRNFVFDNRKSPVKPARSPSHPRGSRDSSPFGLRSEAAIVSVNPRRDRGASSSGRDQNRGRSRVSPTRSDNSTKSPNRRVASKGPPEHHGRVSPAQSPKIVTWGRSEPVQTTERTNRGGAILDEEDECFSMVSRSRSQADEERWKVEEYNTEGKSLLERCEKLLHSIAEMTAAAAEATESQPSPVSVLDSSLYHEESSPSPVMKRSLEFTEQPTESEDEAWGSSVKSEDSQLIYISDVLWASDYLPQHCDIFSTLEKQQCLKGKSATLERRLTFDTVQEIISRRRRLPPWIAMGEISLQQIWSEFQKMRDRSSSSSSAREEEDDLAGVVCGALRRDLAEEAWNQVEVSEAVLDIERLVFKDLIGELFRIS
ncbi:PREDICTED: uncharacterized protein LOC104817570 [Tarenaya hassleriana]|uniref:uncharacterized protein LOC104817570 n=1 Tax=Tarenaya hassleriana TaxID=28532 RepID=UPI00053C4349|nr:PREDICTED: uncharacterized protein LOC104817570 [Tarenaya hassleriana]